MSKNVKQDAKQEVPAIEPVEVVEIEDEQTLPLLIAIDDGSGNMETHLEDEHGTVIERKTPSCVVPKVLPSLGGGVNDHAWKTEGKHYTVVQSSPEAVDTCSKDYQLSQANRVLVHNTIASLKVEDYPVYLGVTLPTEQFYNRNSEELINKARIEAKKANLLVPCENYNGAFHTPNIAGVRVYPEAIPAYVYCSMEGGEDYPEEHTTLVIDLGRYTCDMAIVTTGYNITNFITTENGVHKLVDRFKVLLQQNADRLGLHDISGFSSTNIDQMIDLGYIGSTLNTEKAIASRKDVSDLVQEAKEHLNDLILADALPLAGNDFSMLTRIVFVGGGANWLRELSQEWYHTVDVPNEPEMAIVRGTYMMLKGAADDIYAEVAQAEADNAAVELVEEAEA